jgi:hypothetical protein
MALQKIPGDSRSLCHRGRGHHWDVHGSQSPEARARGLHLQLDRRHQKWEEAGIPGQQDRHVTVVNHRRDGELLPQREVWVGTQRTEVLLHSGGMSGGQSP